MSSNGGLVKAHSSHELACWVSEQSCIYGAIIRGLPLKALTAVCRQFITYTEERWDSWAHRERCMAVQAGISLHAGLNRAIDAKREARGKAPQARWITPKRGTQLGEAMSKHRDYCLPSPLLLWGEGLVPDRCIGSDEPLAVFEDE